MRPCRQLRSIGLLACGEPDDETARLLRAVYEREVDPYVVIPCAEALARHPGHRCAAGRLAASPVPTSGFPCSARRSTH
ncbi:hypothetical protein ACU686_10215 [Yinghuangia aomiensis]